MKKRIKAFLLLTVCGSLLCFSGCEEPEVMGPVEIFLRDMDPEGYEVSCDEFRLRYYNFGGSTKGFDVHNHEDQYLPSELSRNLDIRISRKGEDRLSIEFPLIRFDYHYSKTLRFPSVRLVEAGDHLSLAADQPISVSLGGLPNCNNYGTLTNVTIDTERSFIRLEDDIAAFVIFIDWGLSADYENQVLHGIEGGEYPGSLHSLEHYLFNRNAYASPGRYLYKTIDNNDPQVKAGILEIVPR